VGHWVRSSFFSGVFGTFLPSRRGRSYQHCRRLEVTFAVRRSPFTVHRSPFAVHRSPFTVPRSPFTVPRSPFTVRRSPFPVRRSPFPVRRWPLAVRRSPLAGGRSSGSKFGVVRRCRWRQTALTITLSQKSIPRLCALCASVGETPFRPSSPLRLCGEMPVRSSGFEVWSSEFGVRSIGFGVLGSSARVHDSAAPSPTL